MGAGEIIDANSRPGEPGNQIDIVVYKREDPKLAFGGDGNAFLVEPVVATIEVKSTPTKDDLRQAIQTARAVKKFQRTIVTVITAAYQAPSILSDVVAYDGPARMETGPKASRSGARPWRWS